MTASAATAAVSARRMRGPSGIAVTKGKRAQLAPLGLGKAAFRPDQQAELLLRDALQRRQRIVGGGILVAEDQPPIRLPARQQPVELDRLAHLGNGEDAALLGRLDRIGRDAVGADLGDLRVLGDDRLQHAGAHLDRLLHEIVEPALLQRREAVDEIGTRRLRPRLFDGREPHRLPGPGGDPRQPFAVAAVEDQQLGAFAKPQHIRQIVALLLGRLDRLAGGEVGRRRTAAAFCSWRASPTDERAGAPGQAGCVLSGPWPGASDARPACSQL